MNHYLVKHKTFNKIFILNDDNIHRFINHVDIITSSLKKEGILLYCYFNNIY